MAKRTRNDAPSQLVVIGSSAGGIEALGELLSSLPRDLPAPVLLAQHLDPTRESHLAEILGRHSEVPIRTVVDRERLEAGVVFAVPSNRHVSIADHEVSLESRRGRSPAPSIDRLLSTAADAYGEGLIAVILTGAGSDGAEGARRVKQAGGTVLIQDPATASYPSMPRSLAPTTVDLVADLPSMGSLLEDLLRGGADDLEHDDELITTFLEELRDTVGLDFGRYKRPTISRRIHRRLVATGASSLGDYLRQVRADPEELQRLANSFLIKVTEFFRDEAVYSHLRDRIFPELVAEAAKEQRDLRLWSAGCATGEEAYSLAILAAEAVAAAGADVRVRLFATDVDGEAIEFARRGVYSAQSVAGLPEDLRARYFLHHDDVYEVVPMIRSTIVFGLHDLGQRAPFPRIDLAVCRNVLIYFTSSLQRRALELFAFSLRDGGYLVLGKSESVTPLAEHFDSEHGRLKIYQRRGTPVALARAGGMFTSGRGLTGSPMSRRSLEVTRGSDSEIDRLRAQISRADDLLRRLPVGVAVVTPRYDVLTVNFLARELLGIHGTAVGEDLVHAVMPEAAGPLRRAIDEAVGSGASQATVRVPEVDGSLAGDRLLEVTCYQERIAADAVEPAIVVVVANRTADDRAVKQRDTAMESERSKAVELAERLDRLTQTVTSLRRANQELTVSNADLRRMNDELMVSNEEVQAATEEVETLNEEMQATNEELETLNEELQATVEELNATNRDIEHRRDELQRLAINLERQREASDAERSRLLATISSMSDGVVVVDGSGRSVLRNRAFEEMFGTSGPAAMEDESGATIPDDEGPIARAARDGSVSMHFVTRDPEANRRWFEARGRSIGKDEGAVVVIRDVTERSLQQLQDEFVAILSHELRNPLAGVLGYLDLLHRRMREQPGSRELRYAERALDQTRRFATLVDELFDASRLRRGRLSLNLAEIDLAELATEAAEVAAAFSEDHELRVDPGSAALRAEVDRDRVQQVLLNLLSNAIRHAPEARRIEIRLRRRGRFAEIAVRDHGPGLDAQRLEQLRDRLAQPLASLGEPGEGLGLGLYISHGIVHAHGGSLEVESTPGEGTTMRVRLPLRPRRR